MNLKHESPGKSKDVEELKESFIGKPYFQTQESKRKNFEFLESSYPSLEHLKHLKGPVKIASFDMDWTLIQT